MIKRVVAILCLLFMMHNISGGAFGIDDKIVILETNQGAIEIRLMSEVAPKAC